MELLDPIDSLFSTSEVTQKMDEYQRFTFIHSFTHSTVFLKIIICGLVFLHQIAKVRTESI